MNHIQLVNDWDQWCWEGFRYGLYSVSKARQMIDKFDQHDTSHPTFWYKFVPIKINVFIWRLRLRRLPTKSNLLAKGMEFENDNCCVCDNGLEDDLHAFANCVNSKLIWLKVASWINLDIPSWNSLDGLRSWVDGVPIIGNHKTIVTAIIYSTLWNIWRLRNSSTFKDSKFRKCHVLDSIVVDSFNWLYARFKKSRVNWTVWLQNPLNAL
ncbi:uncharacterized protein [Rutidosis leptorrhynchoides]|uniref:uncharacterized protein n=1 Tax=Rutidosis leptorrhynchoides TaxID=125765 RepID=UPI003A997FFC